MRQAAFVPFQSRISAYIIMGAVKACLGTSQPAGTDWEDMRSV